MRVKFELIDNQEQVLGSADVSTSFGDVKAIKLALHAIGHTYYHCYWVYYTIWDDFHADSIYRGRLYIEPWEEYS